MSDTHDQPAQTPEGPRPGDWIARVRTPATLSDTTPQGRTLYGLMQAGEPADETYETDGEALVKEDAVARARENGVQAWFDDGEGGPLERLYPVPDDDAATR